MSESSVTSTDYTRAHLRHGVSRLCVCPHLPRTQFTKHRIDTSLDVAPCDKSLQLMVYRENGCLLKQYDVKKTGQQPPQHHTCSGHADAILRPAALNPGSLLPRIDRRTEHYRPLPELDRGGGMSTRLMRCSSSSSVGLWSCESARASPRRLHTQRLSPALATHSSSPRTTATT